MLEPQTHNAIHQAIAYAGLTPSVREWSDLSGGCIHRVVKVTLECGTAVVAKVASADQSSLLEEESAGLRALHDTNTVLTPRVLCSIRVDDHAVLLMEEMRRAAAVDESWRRFGEELAALHRCRTSLRL